MKRLALALISLVALYAAVRVRGLTLYVAANCTARSSSPWPVSREQPTESLDGDLKAERGSLPLFGAVVARLLGRKV
jgi:hypothetical protein